MRSRPASALGNGATLALNNRFYCPLPPSVLLASTPLEEETRGSKDKCSRPSGAARLQLTGLESRLRAPDSRLPARSPSPRLEPPDAAAAAVAAVAASASASSPTGPGRRRRRRAPLPPSTMGDAGSERSKAPSLPPRCPCGFWGSSKTMNLCSKCFADFQKKQPDDDSTPSTSNSQSDLFSGEMNSDNSNTSLTTPTVNSNQQQLSTELNVTSTGKEECGPCTDIAHVSLITPTKRSCGTEETFLKRWAWKDEMGEYMKI
ncbi:AN1-type zinc finger protein 3 isoform X4 [Sarcophilus harrisii]|uniref:AN1-type zinc finger protein 3 isoform X4 n=1 Tax=Sarcophilus harrisii TaxID=9305 RepID=UPI001301E196|nr:AN1-type zinc finger protein 3 isoform X4 [Sarcophilus harrisii]